MLQWEEKHLRPLRFADDRVLSRKAARLGLALFEPNHLALFEDGQPDTAHIPVLLDTGLLDNLVLDAQTARVLPRLVSSLLQQSRRQLKLE